ncbi:MAG: putative chitinase [Limisphaerales bacterium]|jgi:hypothetical protein
MVEGEWVQAIGDRENYALPGDGSGKTVIADPDHYEARAEAAASKDGKSLWVAYERGTVRWGKDLGSEWRKLGGGLNYDRRIKFIKVDLESGPAPRRSSG